MTTSKVAIVMGSTSDQATMHHAAETLEGLGVEYETRVLSAHRTPEALREWVESLHDRGVRVVICGAGGAAHLAGAVAALTTLPVIGVPLVAPNAIAGGLDALLRASQGGDRLTATPAREALALEGSTEDPGDGDLGVAA